MDESGTLPSDPSAKSDDPSLEVTPGSASAPSSEETEGESTPPAPPAEPAIAPDAPPTAAPAPAASPAEPAIAPDAPPTVAPAPSAPPAEPAIAPDAPPTVAPATPAASAEPALAPDAPGAPPTADHAAAAAEQDRLAQDNAQRLERQIQELRAGRSGPAPREFHALFELEQRLHGLFKQMSPLHASDRHRLWNALKQAGVELRRAHQLEWESRRYQSVEACEAIEEKLREVEALAQGAPDAGAFHRAESLLNQARALLGSDAPDAPGRTLIGPDRRACWERWRKVRDALRQVRGAQQERDYQALAAPIAEVIESARSGDAFEAIRRVKELQARLGRAYLRRGQFEDLRKRLSEAWQAAQSRVSEQRRERSARREEWRARMEGHLARWRATLEQRLAQREHLIQQRTKLEGMEKNARSEEFAAQARGWLQETEEKLSRTEASLAELDERIRTTTRQLGGRSTGRPAGRARATPSPESPAEPERPGAAPEGPPDPPDADS